LGSDPWPFDERGFSLIEVVLVVLIMGILASVAAQKWGGAIEQSRFEATRSEMQALRTAIVGNADLMSNGMRSDFGYVGDVGGLPPNLDALMTNPGGYATWNGPYVRNDFTQHAAGFKEDAWGVAYAYDGGVTISSTGSGSMLSVELASSTADLMANSVAGSITDALGSPPGAAAAQVEVTLTYPDGHGGVRDTTVTPNPGGSFTFSEIVPIGNHALTVICDDVTLTRYVSVLPGSTAYVDLRVPGNTWSKLHAERTRP